MYKFLLVSLIGMATFLAANAQQLDKSTEKLAIGFGGATVAGSGATMIFGLTSGEWTVIGIIVGSACTILTTLANIAFKIYQSRRGTGSK